jgi:hypothetical protein
MKLLLQVLRLRNKKKRIADEKMVADRKSFLRFGKARLG